MSMNTSVYVGPYIECDGISNELLESFESVVCNGQGENTDWKSSKRYLIPNKPLGVNYRQMSFDKHDSPSPIPLLNADANLETQRFSDMSANFMDAAMAAGVTCKISWGVVVGCF